MVTQRPIRWEDQCLVPTRSHPPHWGMKLPHCGCQGSILSPCSQSTTQEPTELPMRTAQLLNIQKVVLKLEYLDERVKQKVMKKVSVAEGVDSISIDSKDKKLTVTGNVDPVELVSKVKKLCHTEILSVGPAKEPEKKKDEQKKEDAKKKDDKNGDDKKKLEAAAIKAYPAPVYYQYPHYPTHVPARYHHYHSMEEDPTSCVIC